MFVLQIIDWGLLQNGTHNRKLFQRGEIVQVILVMFGEHVWIERSEPLDLYRVAFGYRPPFTEQVTADQAKQIIVKHFADKLAQVTS